VQSLADEVLTTPPGWGVRTHALRLVWTLNQLHIADPISVTEVLALADRHQADLPYRHIVVADDPTAHQLELHLETGSWKVDREVLMVLMAPPTREIDASRVIELDENEMLALMRRWHIEEHSDITIEGLSQLEAFNRREGRLWNESRFGAIGDGGVPAAITKLRLDGTTGWVEDVYTVPEERGRGIARMLVTHVTGLARSAACDLTFIVADDNDWPKHLYAEIGFRPVGKRWIFHRELAE